MRAVSVLDVGCGETGRSSKLIARNPDVLEVVGFDPCIPKGQVIKGKKFRCVHGTAEEWTQWEGFDWIVSMYNSVDYINPPSARDKVIKAIIQNAKEGVVIATHRRFVPPFGKNWIDRLRWNFESIFLQYNKRHGGTYNRGISYPGLILWQVTSNMKYYAYSKTRKFECAVPTNSDMILLIPTLIMIILIVPLTVLHIIPLYFILAEIIPISIMLMWTVDGVLQGW